MSHGTLSRELRLSPLPETMPDALSGHAGGHLAADRGRIRRKIADYILGCRYAGRSHPVPDTDGAGASDGARLHILEKRAVRTAWPRAQTDGGLLVVSCPYGREPQFREIADVERSQRMDQHGKHFFHRPHSATHRKMKAV